MSPVLKAGVQRAPPSGRGLGVSPRVRYFSPLPSRKGARGMVRAPIEAQLPQAGSPEGRTPSGRRYGGCASITYSSLFPPSFQEGGQGDGAPHNRSAAPASGESRGAYPLWQAVWRMCLHNLLLFISPFLPGRGPGGWSASRLTAHAVRQRAERAGPALARPRGGGRPDPRLAVARPSGGSRSRCRPYSPPTPGHSGAIRHSRHGR